MTGESGAEGVTTVGFVRAARLVAEREVLVRLRDRGFIISTLVTVLLVAGSFVAPVLLDRGPENYTVATVGDAAGQVVAEAVRLAEEAADDEDDEDGGESAGGDGSRGVGEVPDAFAGPLPAFDGDVTLVARTAPDAAAAERLVIAEEVDVAVVSTGLDSLRLIAADDVPSDLARALLATAQDVTVRERLAATGLSPDAVADALAPVAVEERLLDPDAGDGLAAFIVGTAFAFLFFFTVFTYGLTIAQSVTEEKQSRVVELLVAVVPVRALLVGKVLGNLVLAVGQLVLLVAVGLAAAAVAGQGDVVPLLVDNAAWFLVFFLLGFAMLACLWAATGAMANRIEDLGSTTLPVQILVLVPFFVAFTITDEGPARAVLSYFPLTAPIVMPQRLVAGDAGWIEALGAVAVIAATATLLILVAERLYRGSLLRTRGKASLRDAWTTANT